MKIKSIIFLATIFFLQVQFSAHAQIRYLLFNSYDDIVKMDFQSGSPVISYTGLANGYEGIAHAEDGAGNIVFFVNANGVYNSALTLMPGSVGMLADPSSAEIDICPWPRHAGQYFVIYNGQTCSDMYYSVVDMNLNGGLGDVTQLNISLNQPNVSEGFEVVRASCELYRVLFYTCDVGFQSYNIDSTGINTPTILLAFPHPTPGPDGRGELDYNNGRIGFGFNTLDFAFLADYNVATNVVSNPVTVALPITSVNGTYGIEFSPDGSKAYISCWYDLSGANNLWQYDFNSAALQGWFINSTPIGFGEEGPGQIEIGTDGKLYMINNGSHEITCIANPNTLAPAFSTIIVTSQLALGISDHIQTDLFLTFDFVTSSSCNGSTITFTPTGSTCSVDSIHWNFGDGTTVTSLNPTHTFTTAGNFTVHMYLYYGAAIDSISHTQLVTVNMLSGFSVYAGADQTIDGGASAQLNATVNVPGAYTYLWTPSNTVNDPTIINPLVSPSGNTTYTITVTNAAGCFVTDTVSIFMTPGISVPNAFTPNGDGINDVFQITNPQLATSLNVNIYSRWGQLLFSSKEPDFKWDGNYIGQPEEMGSYVYVITYTQASHPESRMFKGNVTLIR